MSTRSTRRTALAAGFSLAFAFWSAVASASLNVQLNGDPFGHQYFFSQATNGYQFPGGSNFSGDNGNVYSSNFAPLSPTTVSADETHNGAHVVASAQGSLRGLLWAQNHAQISVTNGQAADGYYVTSGQGARSQVSFHSPDAVVAGAHWTWHVGGLETADIGVATARIDFLAGQYGDKDFNYLFSSPDEMRRVGMGTYDYNTAVTADTPIDLFFWASAYCEVDRGQVTQGQSFFLNSEYSSTYYLESLVLVDSNDQPITNWTMQDGATGETVWDQNGRVPEPAAIALIGCSAMLMMRRR